MLPLLGSVIVFPMADVVSSLGSGKLASLEILSVLAGDDPFLKSERSKVSNVMHSPLLVNGSGLTPYCLFEDNPVNGKDPEMGSSNQDRIYIPSASPVGPWGCMYGWYTVDTLLGGIDGTGFQDAPNMVDFDWNGQGSSSLCSAKAGCLSCWTPASEENFGAKRFSDSGRIREST